MAKDTALAVKTDEILPDVITPASAPMKLEQMSKMIGYMEEFIKNLLNREVDFGLIPGTNKPTLYKAGAEKLCMAFGLSEKYEIVASRGEPFREWEYTVSYYDKTQKKQVTETKKTRGYYYFSVLCKLIHKGTEVVWASQIGDCESTERGRETAPSNTILKMAQKRAFVGATLHATFTSDRFTADMDTYGEQEGKPAPKGKSKPATSSDDSGFRMPFGKHKGDLITEVPVPYLQWCLDKMDNLHDETRKIIEAEIKRDRNGKDKPTDPEQTDDPVRDDVIDSILKLERKISLKDKAFKIDETRIKALNSADFAQATDDALVQYLDSLRKHVSA